MKKYLFAFLVIMLCATLIGCTTTTETVGNHAPTQESLELQSAGGDDTVWFYSMYNFKGDFISSTWTKVLDWNTVDQWSKQYDKDYEEGVLDTTYPTLAKFIKDLNLSKDTCMQYVNLIQKNCVPTDPQYITEEEIDLIFTWDKKRVNAYFVSEYAVYANGEIYTPYWILNHSAEDYKAAGITAAQLEEKLPEYKKCLGEAHKNYADLYTKKINDLKALEK